MNIITQIKNFMPRMALQQKSKDEILNQLSHYGEKIYDRNMCHGHMTASAIILNPQLDKILMVHHNIYGSYAWVGGHSDGEEDLYRVAYEEAREETGIEKFYPVTRNIISVESLPVDEHIKKREQVETHNHYNVTFGFICSEKEQLKIKPDENSDVRWIDIEQLAEYCTEAAMIPIYEDNIHYIQSLMAEKRKNYENLPKMLLPWYEKNARQLSWRRDQNPYHIWLSEIMLQQTRVDTVIDYYHRFLEAFPTVYALADADIERVLKLWEGLGYYSRARNLHKCAVIIVEKYNGEFPKSYQELVALPGIGNYTAGAIASISFNLPIAAVDGNVLRVISRITEDYRCIDHQRTKKEVGEKLGSIYPQNRCGDFTQSLMELGATVCLPTGNPLCHQCPVRDICMADKNGTQEFLPVRKEKVSRKMQQKTLFVFNAQGKIALQRREEKGVLKGMWALPNVEGILNKKEVSSYMEQLDALGYTVKEIQKGQHIFTHIKWEMLCYYIYCEETFDPYIWVDSETLEKEYAIPTAFKKFLKA